MNIRERNKGKIEELKPSVQWAAIAWENCCWRADDPIEILEAYRTPERQRALYAKGRTKPGKKVTWTLKSKHTDRIALDVRPYGKEFTTSFHKRIVSYAERYGITNPLAAYPYFDLGHFEFDNVAPKSPEPNMKTQIAKNVILRLVERAERRIGSMPPETAKRLSERLKRLKNKYYIS